MTVKLEIYSLRETFNWLNHHSPLVSLVGVAVERPLVGSGVVVAPPILVVVGVITAIAAVGSVAVALVVRAVVIAVATVAGHDDGRFRIGSREMN